MGGLGVTGKHDPRVACMCGVGRGKEGNDLRWKDTEGKFSYFPILTSMHLYWAFRV